MPPLQTREHASELSGSEAIHFGASLATVHIAGSCQGAKELQTRGLLSLQLLSWESWRTYVLIGGFFSTSLSQVIICYLNYVKRISIYFPVKSQQDRFSASGALPHTSSQAFRRI